MVLEAIFHDTAIESDGLLDDVTQLFPITILMTCVDQPAQSLIGLWHARTPQRIDTIATHLDVAFLGLNIPERPPYGGP